MWREREFQGTLYRTRKVWTQLESTVNACVQLVCLLYTVNNLVEITQFPLTFAPLPHGTYLLLPSSNSPKWLQPPTYLLLLWRGSGAFPLLNYLSFKEVSSVEGITTSLIAKPINWLTVRWTISQQSNVFPNANCPGSQTSIFPETMGTQLRVYLSNQTVHNGAQLASLDKVCGTEVVCSKQNNAWYHC